MSKKYVIVEDNSMGCCNLVLWDFFIVAICVGATIHYELNVHTVFCIILGVIIGFLFIFLISRKYIGTILKILCSTFWTWGIFQLLDDFFSIKEKIAGDMIWTWTIRIVLFLFCLGLHFLGTKEITDEEDYSHLSFDESNRFNQASSTMSQADLVQILEESNAITNDLRTIMFEQNNILKQARQVISTGTATTALQNATARNQEQFLKLINKYNSYIEKLNNSNNYRSANKTIWDLRKCLNSMKTENQYVLNELNKVLQENAQYHSNRKKNTTAKNTDESLFNGCKSKDDLTKRYRKLMQTFHPDNATGDTEMTQKIQNTYEHLLKKYN